MSQTRKLSNYFGVSPEKDPVWPEEFTKPLPKGNRLPGTVCAQFRTVKGKTYGPYFFRFWRDCGKLRKQYVRAAEYEETMLACCRHTIHKRHYNRENSRRRFRLIRAYVASLPGKLAWEIARDEARLRARRERRRKGAGRAVSPPSRTTLDGVCALAVEQVRAACPGCDGTEVGHGHSCSTTAGGAGGGA